MRNILTPEEAARQGDELRARIEAAFLYYNPDRENAFGAQSWFQREAGYSARQSVWRACKGLQRLSRQGEAYLTKLERAAGLA